MTRPDLHSFPTRRSSDLSWTAIECAQMQLQNSSFSTTWLPQPARRLQRKIEFLPKNGILLPYRPQDRKSTRLNSSHMSISYAVFCLKKKKSEDPTENGRQ